jgi:hypothetical protein
MRRAEIAAERRRSPRETALNQWMRAQILIASGRSGEARPAHDDAVAEFERMEMTWHAQRAQRQIELRRVDRPVLT